LARQPAIGRLQCVVVDCPDVLILAAFYQALVGGTVNRADPRWVVGDDFATLHTAAGAVLAFQRVPDYQPPRWPDGAYPQQFHLDIDVQDRAAARQLVTGLGGKVLTDDPRGWAVCSDPAGHPFCLLQG
jgi:hypothetical protein